MIPVSLQEGKCSLLDDAVDANLVSSRISLLFMLLRILVLHAFTLRQLMCIWFAFLATFLLLFVFFSVFASTSSFTTLLLQGIRLFQTLYLSHFGLLDSCCNK